MPSEAIRKPTETEANAATATKPPTLRSVKTPAEGGPDTAEDMSRLAKWAVATFRPPDFWNVQPSAREELEYAKAAPYAPKGVSRALSQAYGFAVAGLITGLLAAIWVLRSPARTTVAVFLATTIAVAAYLTW